jgi:MFS family permease
MNRSAFQFFSAFFGIFSLMALSNAIVPILPNLNVPLDMQTFIYSAYFFGAMVTTLPGGIISERIGQAPVIGTGLALSLLSGFLLLTETDSVFILLARIIEGVGAGLLVTAALSWINNQSGHVRLSGIFMALLNLGLLTGMVSSGWIAGNTGIINGGILFFTALSLIPFVSILIWLTSGWKRLLVQRSPGNRGSGYKWGELLRVVPAMVMRQASLFISVIVLLGITGFVQALYPDLSDLSAFQIGVTLALMNLATIIASLIAPWFRIEPVLLIRLSAILMAGLVLIFIEYPLSVFIMGFLAGLIMISQINYLASAEKYQGIAMGLFSTSSYAGMTLLPAIGGYVAGLTTIGAAAAVVALLAIICAIIIGRCQCRGFQIPSG